MALSAASALIAFLLALRSTAEDIGYELLFKSAPEEFTDRCFEVQLKVPSWAHGDFLISSVGLMEYNDRKFVGVLDTFGKLHKFSLRENKVCATFRVMRTQFFNNSQKADTIAPALLFYETEPPRKCPFYNPFCNVMAPNDNSYVVTYSVGGEIISTTDSQIQVTVDPASLNVTGNFMIGKESMHKGQISFLGSAHPVIHPNGEFVNFIGSGSITMSDKTTISPFRMTGKPSDPANRHQINKFEMETPPYMHSFAISEHHLVFPHMPIKFGMGSVLEKQMADAMTDIPITSDSDPNNAFYIVPLNGSEPRICPMSANHKLYYIHTLNSYENNTGIVVDLTTIDVNPFSGTLDRLDGQLNKTARDLTQSHVVVVTRFLLPWDGNKHVTTELLSHPRKKTEFPKINPLFARKKHCFYWANTWFNDLESYASMAVIKYDICGGGKTLQWTRQHWYPSEPFMVPSLEKGAAEDDGYLLITATDGNKGEASFIVLDAKTLGIVSETAHFPHIPYTAHGNFYPVGALSGAKDPIDAEAPVITEYV